MTRPQNFKEQVVEQREFENVRSVKEDVAEFEYSPTKCRKTYRVVVVWKGTAQTVRHRSMLLLHHQRSQMFRRGSGLRCQRSLQPQENTIEQHKNDVRSLTAPVDNLVSNCAYMVMASLAGSLKEWSALLLPSGGRWKEKHEQEKERLLRMDFSTFRNAWINVPAQIIHSSRRIVYRLLSWNPWQSAFFRLLDVLHQLLRC